MGEEDQPGNGDTIDERALKSLVREAVALNLKRDLE